MSINITPIDDIAVVENAADSTINLFNTFDDPRTTGLVARFELYDTSLAGGITDVLLFDQAGAGAPLTVQNFQNYVERGAYDNSIIHRAVPGFVVQGGGFVIDDLQVSDVVSDPPVVNEFSADRSNLRGTIAMAKLGGDPNSATNQWFFNLADNSTNLDNQNGGFTVFGEVLSEEDIAVADAIAALRIVNGTSINGAFSDLPTTSEDNTFDNDDELVRYRTITISEQDELTFEVFNNSNPSVVSAVINNGQLVLDYLQPGTSEVVVRATNLLGQTIDDTFSITVETAPAPTNPTPTDPTPTDPTPTDPIPTDPTPTDPDSTDPDSTDPDSTDPDPIDPNTPTPNPPQPSDPNVPQVLVGSNNADRLSGGNENNEIDGGGGNDTIFGRNGNDQLTGGAGQDRLIGGNGNDNLNGGRGKDKLNGGKGNDQLSGGGGSDTLNGGQGNDELLGGGGNDKLRGGKGQDILDGGKGNNILIGGKGSDIFVLSSGKGRSIIRDFKDGQDQLQVSGSITITQVGNDTLISLDNDELALLKGIDAGLITRADFTN